METLKTLIALTQDEYNHVLSSYPDSKKLVVEGDRIADLPDKVRRSGAVLGKSYMVLVNLKTSPDYHPSREDMDAFYEITGMFGREGFEIKVGYAQSADIKGARVEVIYQES